MPRLVLYQELAEPINISSPSPTLDLWLGTQTAVLRRLIGGGESQSFVPLPAIEDVPQPWLQTNELPLKPPRLPIAEYQFIARPVQFEDIAIVPQPWLEQNNMPPRVPRLPISEYQTLAWNPSTPAPIPPGVAVNTQFVNPGGDFNGISSDGSFVVVG